MARSGPQRKERRVKVAIVGGGCAGLAAAWELSRLPGYDVSVYEKSWRLGGKGASSRADDGRVLEHGLHVWLGFYENAFKMIRGCYDEVTAQEWGPNHADEAGRLSHGRFEDAFFPEPHIGVTGRQPGDKFRTVWSGFLPPVKGLPGDPLDPDSNPFTLASYLMRCVEMLKALMLSVIARPDEEVPGRPRSESRSDLDEAVDLDFSLDPTESPELLVERIAGRVRDGTLTAAAAMLQAVTIVENILSDLNHSPQIAGSALNLMRALAAQVRKQLRDVVKIDPKLRWKTEVIDIVMTIAVGLYRDRALLDGKGLDALNEFDYREWLFKHGATKTSIDSRFISGIYDLVFAYPKGNREKPRLAAGVALRGALRMFFTYRGSMFWRMRSGMGDAVFAPLYKVMTLDPEERLGAAAKQHPVTFHFLHELSDVTLSADAKGQPFVTQLKFTTPVAPGHLENPARALDHLGCWAETPEPLLEGLKQGKKTVELNIGEQFDAVIFAMGLDDFSACVKDPHGKPLAHVPPTWATAARSDLTVATKAAQVWLTRSLEDLGWYRGSGIVSALGLTFDTWADMTHTRPTERVWRDGPVDARAADADGVRSIAYFCGVLADATVKDSGDLAATLEQEVAKLLTEMQSMWPTAGAIDPHDIVAMHVQANVSGSDRYSLSLPGTIAGRLSPLDPSVSNAAVAGDWTACGLDVGCVEAAVMSGMLAAHAITGTRPTLRSIVGYDHP